MFEEMKSRCDIITIKKMQELITLVTGNIFMTHKEKSVSHESVGS